jgi:hypothetical protein
MARNKQQVNINLPPEIVEKARSTGLNISKVCENALISMLTCLDPSISVNEGSLKNRRFSLEGRRGDLNVRKTLGAFKDVNIVALS